ncbi:MAG: ATP synthase F1 subunit delta [Deltaproteobacteria bacterium]|nr:ATP synthase F1 subunit delta [Deltaproteobacteria bacterium]
MIESSIARRYSRALVELAREEDKLEAYGGQLKDFYALCAEVPPLLDTLTNRFFDITARLKIVDRLAEKLNLALPVKNFVKLLIKKGRIGLLAEISAEYQRALHELQNRAVATVVSAKELSDSVVSEIRTILAKKTGLEVVMEKEVKPSVLGGVCVRIGGVVYDGTVRAELNRLTEKMMGG